MCAPSILSSQNIKTYGVEVSQLAKDLLLKIKEVFEKDLYNWQLKAVDTSLNGRDVFVIKSTGGGKSLTFQSLCLKHPRAIVLVVVPTNAIMRDQVIFAYSPSKADF